MGQRHQIFVLIPNPVKHLRLDNTEKVRLQKEFGTKEFSIIAYHNQWLYGRSALQNAIALLNFGAQFTKEQKTTTKGWNAYDCPFTPNGMGSKFDTPEKITTAIGFIMNYRPVKTPYLDAGIGGSWYIGKTDEGINFDFTRGDNNDGITIIDLIENKYCFMNIYEQRIDSHSASQLPMLKPVKADDYVRAYYGETEETINDYYIKDKTPKQIAEILADNVKHNVKCILPFKKFGVLTLDEIGAMFDKMEAFKLRDDSKKALAKGTKIKLFEKK